MTPSRAVLEITLTAMAVHFAEIPKRTTVTAPFNSRLAV